MKNIRHIFLTLALLTIIVSCSGNNPTEPPNVGLPQVTTAPVSNVSLTTAVCGGQIAADGGAPIIVYGVCWSRDSLPTIHDAATTDSAATDSFTSYLTGLTPNTTYNVRAYATNSVGTSYGAPLSITTLDPANTVTDIDGNVYRTVLIGNQVWMAENLRVTHYRNGGAILNVPDSTVWSVLASGAYCDYANDPRTASTYGRLYNWNAVTDLRGLAPEGWHVASDSEWMQLEACQGLGQEKVGATGWRGTTEGGKLKAANTTLWLSPNTDATNQSGFTALPGGNRICFNRGVPTYFMDLGCSASFWTSSSCPNNDFHAMMRSLSYAYATIARYESFMQSGYSVRCVKN